MTTRKHPHDAPEGEPREPATASLEAKIAELESAVAEALAVMDEHNIRVLPVLDDLHSVLEHKPAGIDKSWVKGLELSVRKLEEALGTHGLQPIEAVGSRFDPKLHEAVGHEESRDHPEDTVVSELRRGYRVRDRVVRPALVKVARPPAGTDDTGTQ